MFESEKTDRRTLIERLAGSLMLLSFGLALLAYLIAIDRAEWFDLRPASGTAAAMSNASRDPGGNAATRDSRDLSPQAKSAEEMAASTG